MPEKTATKVGPRIQVGNHWRQTYFVEDIGTGSNVWFIPDFDVVDAAQSGVIADEVQDSVCVWPGGEGTSGARADNMQAVGVRTSLASKNAYITVFGH